MNRSSNYTVVPNPLGGYAFSISRCRAAEIGAYVIGAAIFALTAALLCFSAERGREWRDLRDNFLFPVCFSVPFLLGGISMTCRIRRVRRLLTEGEAVRGEIVSYSRVHAGWRSMSGSPNRTVLHVRFWHRGAAQECDVPAGHRLPEKALAAPACTVCILQDRVFVTDFVLRRKGDTETVRFEVK